MLGDVTVIRGQLSGDAALDTATSRAILLRCADGSIGETLQVGCPHRVIAFGKQDAISDGFRTATDIAAAKGWDPCVRIAGGRAVVFSPRIVRFAWTIPTDDPARDMRRNFGRLADAVVSALGTLGVPSEVAETPGEYCAGEFSVRVLGSRKVMGVGQRLARTAAQVGGMIVVEDEGEINEVLVPVYEALAVAMDPAATGSIADVRKVDAVDLMDSLVRAIASDRVTSESGITPETAMVAATLRDDHRPAHLRSEVTP